MEAKESFKWNLQDVYNVFVLTFIFELLLFLVLNVFGAGDFVKSVKDIPLVRGLLLLFVYLLQVTGMIFPLWYFVIRKYSSKIKDFAFNRVGIIKTLIWVFISYVFYIGIGIIVIRLFYILGIDSFGFEPMRSIFEIFGNNPFGIFIAVIVAVGIAPIVEEIFFRGFILQTLIKRISPAWGIILTALIFAAVHFEFQSIMPLLILSFILNILFVKTGSIVPGIIFHIFNNSLALIATLIYENQYWL